MGNDDYAPRYRDLKARQRSDDLALEVYPLTRKLKSIDHSLSSQVLRAAISAPANIAEGYGRSSRKEFVQYLNQAHGSLFELDYWFHFLQRVGLLDSASGDRLTDECRQSSRLVYGLMRAARTETRDHADTRRYLREDAAIYGALDGLGE